MQVSGRRAFQTEGTASARPGVWQGQRETKGKAGQHDQGGDKRTKLYPLQGLGEGCGFHSEPVEGL